MGRSRFLAGTATLIALVVTAGLVAGFARSSPPRPQTVPSAARPMLIAHRGASGSRPENTMAAYRLAVDLGADAIEGDLAISADGVLVLRHDRELSTTTDVAGHPELLHRRTTKEIRGVPVTGWFVEDFTVAELKRLRTTTRHAANLSADLAGYPGTSPSETVPTLHEMLAFARASRTFDGRPLSVFLELKEPSYYRSIGVPVEPLLASGLRAVGLTGPDAPVLLESFDPDSLRTMRGLVDVPLVQLLGGVADADDPAVGPANLAGIRTYAAGIAVEAARLGPWPASDGRVDPSLVDRAHDCGLAVYLYTFTDARHDERAIARYLAYFAAGVDGVFTDDPDVAWHSRMRARSGR